jgi:hypothetical protein
MISELSMPALGGNGEYFHSQTIGNSDRLEARGCVPMPWTTRG